jgi:hypothetical protein
MIKKIIFLVMIIFIILLIQCGLFEPSKYDGSVFITLVKESSEPSIQKTSIEYEAIQCIVNKGSELVYDENLIKRDDGSFYGRIDGLKTASNYSVALYGTGTDGSVNYRGYKDMITVKAGKETHVTITWESFIPKLYSPTDGSTVETNPPALVWDDIGGAEYYELDVADSPDFINKFIDRTPVYGTSYTYELPFSSGFYYWRVMCIDVNGKPSDWSDVWEFQVSQTSLEVTPTILDFGSGSNYQTFNITNTGSGTLNWTITDDSDWITVDPVSGSTTTESDQITVTADRSLLSKGSYNGTITVNVNGKSISVLVYITVEEGAVLSIDPTFLDFGSIDTHKKFFISNTGSGTLNWDITDDINWLSVNTSSGSTTSETDDVVVIVNRKDMAAGNYSSLISVNSDGGSKTITVYMSVPKANLIAYYPLDGDAKDKSSNRNDGTVYGAKLTLDRFGRSDRAYVFDGVDDYIDIPDELLPSDDSDLAFSLWIKTLNRFEPILSNSDGSSKGRFECRTDETLHAGVFYIFIGDDGLVGNHFKLFAESKINDNNWHHIAVLRESGVWKIFIDGKMEASKNSDYLISNKLDLRLGSIGADRKPYFTGKIDDIRFYDYTLAESVIYDLYKEGEWTGSP